MRTISEDHQDIPVYESVQTDVRGEKGMVQVLSKHGISVKEFVKTIGFNMSATPNDCLLLNETPSIDLDQLDVTKPRLADLMVEYGFQPEITGKRFNTAIIVQLRKNVKRKKTTKKRKRVADEENETDDASASPQNGISMKVFPNGMLHITGAQNMTEVLNLLEFGRNFIYLTATSDDRDLNNWIVHKFNMNIINTGFDIGKKIDRQKLVMPASAFMDFTDFKRTAKKKQHMARKFKINVDDGDVADKKYAKTQPSVFVFNTGYVSIICRSFRYFDIIVPIVSTVIPRTDD